MSDSGGDRIRYQPATISKSDWLRVMQATTEYEQLWQRGERPDLQQFVQGYSDLPPGLLDAQLQALRSELQSTEVSGSAGTENAKIPLTLSGRYRQLQLLRRGGMGEVYSALDTECGREVALKKIRPDLAGDLDVQRRFREEGELTASLEHPGVIPIYGRGVDENGLAYYVMRLISGTDAGTLQQAIRRFHAGLTEPNSIEKSAIAFPELIRRVLDVANTMAYAHSRGIVHRDLKPANILLGPYGETLIGDWGLARRSMDIVGSRSSDQPMPVAGDVLSSTDSAGDKDSRDPEGVSSAPIGRASEETQQRRQHGMASAATCGIGTPGFAAPEQLAGKVCNATTLRSADVYSLGAILHSVLTGRTPDRNGAWEPAAKAGPASYHPAAVEQAVGGLQMRLLVAICRRAMSEQPAERYVSVEEFRDDLECWLSGESVKAYAEGWWERLLRWPGRHRMATAMLVTGLLISVLGGAAFLVVTTQQKNRLAQRSQELQDALQRSDRLLQDTTEARRVAERERAAGEISRDRAERREQMAFHAISQFYELFSEREDLRTAAEMSGVREEVLQRSRRFYDQLYQEIEGDLIPNDTSSLRLATAALSLSKLEQELGHQADAAERLEKAVQKLQETPWPNGKALLSQQREFQLARLISQQGQLAMRYGRFDKAGPLLREAVERLEVSCRDQSLPAEQRAEADILRVRAMSTLALHLGAVGKTAEALPLAEKAKQAGIQGPVASVEDAMTRIQLHGNLALLLESSGATEQSLAELALAEQVAETAETLISKDTSATERLELLSMRSKAARSRVRLLQKLNRVTEALAGLQQQLTLDETSLRAFTASHELRKAYGSTAMQLQKQLVQMTRHADAAKVAKQWVDLAEQLLQAGTETEQNLVFLLGAHHTAGHTLEMCADQEGAIEQYRAATSVCERTSGLGFRSPSLVYQILELNCHLATVQVQVSGWSAMVDGFLTTAKQAAEELQRWPAQTEVKPESIPRQLQGTVELLERVGFGEQAGKWKAELQEQKLVP